MIRLFLNLYIVIILGILIINWTAEFIWHETQPSSNTEIETSKFIVKQLVNNFGDSTELQISPTKENKISVKQLNDLAWLPEQKIALNRGEVIVNFDSKEQAIFYYFHRNSNQLIEIGPFSKPETSNSKIWLLKLFSYGLLALVIALWTRPVWRDLNQLAQLSIRIDNNNFATQPLAKSHSPIYPIVKSVNKMANRISHLLTEQKYLVNAVSHELRTPLSRLRFSLALLSNVDKGQLQDIEADVEEVEHLVKEMLDYARIEHIAAKQPFTEVDIVKLLKLQQSKHQRGSKIQIHFDCNGEQIIWVCNSELLTRACQNLVTNAVRYASSQVVITVEKNAHLLTITVEDDGPGIEESEWPHIFDPFSRVDKSRNKQQGGYGLGLAIVKKSSLWHEGSCNVSKASIGGAKFSLQIPSKVLSED